MDYALVCLRFVTRPYGAGLTEGYISVTNDETKGSPW